MNKILVLATLLFSTSIFANNIVYETEWIDSKEMSATLNKMSQNRLFPCTVQGKLEGIEIKYKASYCPFLPNMDYFYSRWGMSDRWYSTYTAQYKELEMTEHTHSTFLDLSGNTVHQATWVLVSGET